MYPGSPWHRVVSMDIKYMEDLLNFRAKRASEDWFEARKICSMKKEELRKIVIDLSG